MIQKAEPTANIIRRHQRERKKHKEFQEVQTSKGKQEECSDGVEKKKRWRRSLFTVKKLPLRGCPIDDGGAAWQQSPVLKGVMEAVFRHLRRPEKALCVAPCPADGILCARAQYNFE